MKRFESTFKLAIFTFVASLIPSCSSNEIVEETGYVITANIEGMQNGQAILMRLNLSTNEATTVDSALITDGKFNFTGQLPEPYLHTILIDSDPPQKIHFFLENSTLTISGKDGALDIAKISGSREDSLFKTYTQDEIFEQEPGLEIMLNYPDYNFAAFVTYYQFQLFNYSLDSMTMIMDGFDESVKKSEYYMHLVPLYNSLKRVSIGQPAPAFQVPNQVGKTVSLADFKGQYIFLDFWASWCKPCREDNPKLVKAYNEVKSKNFEIVSISVDKDREKWLQAIEKDQTFWVHLSNVQGWDEVSSTYGVKAVPQNFLINPEGIIINKNIAIDELAEKLKVILP